jgi:outer membrane protein OmpA-like peptidoglycan-associated protein
MAQRPRTGKRVSSRRPAGSQAGCKAVQLKSVFIAKGSVVPSGKIMAKIYFPTSGHSLDANDAAALDELVDYYRHLLELGYNANLTFVGRADIRYHDDFNLKLSENRAKAARTYVDQRLRGFPKFKSSVRGTGEYYSGQCWAEDRRVDVYEWYQMPPAPAKPKWKKMRCWIRAKSLDLYFYKRIHGAFAVELEGQSQSVHAWDLQVGQVGWSAGPKGKSPVGHNPDEEIVTTAAEFRYNPEQFNPPKDWKKKLVSLSTGADYVLFVIFDAFSKPVSKDYAPIEGLKDGATYLTMKLKTEGVEFGGSVGLPGSIVYVGEKPRSDRA